MKLCLAIITVLNAVHLLNAMEIDGGGGFDVAIPDTDTPRVPCVDHHPMCYALCSQKCKVGKSHEKVHYALDTEATRKKRNILRQQARYYRRFGAAVDANIEMGGGVNYGTVDLGIGRQNPRVYQPPPYNPQSSPDYAKCAELYDATQDLIDAFCPRSCKACGQFRETDHDSLTDKWLSTYCGDSTVQAQPVGLTIFRK